MLVLLRKSGQSIEVDGPCTITLLGWHGRQARIGIEGPPSTNVLRSELVERSASAEQPFLEVA